jgi:hypothetical protein
MEDRELKNLTSPQSGTPTECEEREMCTDEDVNQAAVRAMLPLQSVRILSKKIKICEGKLKKNE